MVNPVAFSLGLIQIRWYGILLALAFFLGYMVVKKLAKEKGLPESFTDDLFVYLIPLGIIGARLAEIIIYEPAYYLANPIKVFFVWEGGLSVHGGFVGAFLATYLVAKKYKLSFYKVADLLPIPFFLGAALGRIGNFINGELVGKVTSLPWGMHFEGYEGLRHPSQLYESVKNFFLCYLTWKMRKKNWPDGCLFWFGIASYSMLRFLVEFVKDLPSYDGLTTAQWISLPLIFIGVIMFFRLKNNRN